MDSLAEPRIIPEVEVVHREHVWLSLSRSGRFVGAQRTEGLRMMFASVEGACSGKQSRAMDVWVGGCGSLRVGRVRRRRRGHWLCKCVELRGFEERISFGQARRLRCCQWLAERHTERGASRRR